METDGLQLPQGTEAIPLLPMGSEQAYAQQQTPGYYAAAVRWVTSSSVLRRLLFFAIIRVGHVSSEAKRSRALLCLSGESIALQTATMRLLAKSFDCAFLGAATYMAIVWPIIVAIVLISNAVSAQKTSWLMLLGVGSMTERLIQSGLLTFFTLIAPCLYAVVSYLKMRQYLSQNAPGLVAQLNQKNKRTCLKELTTMLGISHAYLILTALTEHLRWHALAEAVVPEEVVSRIVTIAQSRQCVTQLSGVQALIRILSGQDEQNIATLARLRESREKIRRVRNAAQCALRRLSKNGQTPLVVKWYAQYSLWALGFKKFTWGDMPFIAIGVIVLWCKLMYVSFLCQMVSAVFRSGDKAILSIGSPIGIGWSNVTLPIGVSWSNLTLPIATPIQNITGSIAPCNAGLVYVYFTRLQQAICSLCGDWTDVFVKDINNAQACLTAFLRYPKTEPRLRAAFQRLSMHTISHLDLTQQAWPHWHDDTWQVLTEASQHWPNLSLNLSFSNASVAVLSASNMFVDFIASHALSSLDIHNVQLADTFAQRLYSQLNTTRLAYLNIDSTPLSNVTTLSFLRGLRHAKQLIDLSFSIRFLPVNEAQLFLDELSSCWVDLPIQNLQVIYGAWTTALINIFSRRLPVTLQSINFSGSGASLGAVDLNLSALAQAMSAFETMALNYCNTNITPYGVDTFAQAMGNVTQLSWDLSVNAFPEAVAQSIVSAALWRNLVSLNLNNIVTEDAAITIVASALPRTGLVTLLLGNTDISRFPLLKLAEQVAHSHLRYLGLPGVPLSEEVFAMISRSLSNSDLLSVDLSGCGLRDSFMLNLVQVLSNDGVKLTAMNLANNQFSQFSARPFVSALAKNSRLVQVDLSGNSWGDALLAELAIHRVWLQKFVCDGCGISTEGLAQFSITLPGSDYTALSFNHNVFNDSALVKFAQQLITWFPERNKIGLSNPSGRFWLGLLGAENATNLNYLSASSLGLRSQSYKALAEVSLPANVLPSHIIINHTVRSGADVGRRLLWPLTAVPRELSALNKAGVSFTSTIKTPSFYVYILVIVVITLVICNHRKIKQAVAGGLFATRKKQAHAPNQDFEFRAVSSVAGGP